MKARVKTLKSEIVIQHRYSSFVADDGFASEETTLVDGIFAGLNVVLDKKTTVTIDRMGNGLTVREKSRLSKEKKRDLKKENIREIVVLVHTQKRTLRRDKKTATVQVVSRLSSEEPVLLFLNEPYDEAITVVSQVSESLGVPVKERDILSRS